MELPHGWQREYEGRYGAEYVYDRRNLSVSVLPRYESALGRASEKTPDRYVVRVHRLLSPDPSVPVTLGVRETFDAAIDLAEKYMRRVDAIAVRSTTTGLLEAFTDVAAYDDDVLLAICRSLTGSGVRSLVHTDDDTLEVPHAVADAPGAVRERLADRIASLRTATQPGDGALYVNTGTCDVVWIPRGETDGTLIELDRDVDRDLPGFLEEIGAYVRGRELDD
jgi:hypothetical protein